MTIIKKHFRVWMLQIIVTTLFLLYATLSSASTNYQVSRTIEVTGSAIMYVQPDEIKLEIVLETRAGISRKNEFLKILHKNNVTLDMLEFKQLKSDWWYYYYNDYDKTEQKFVISIDSTVHALNLMNDLDRRWVKQINVVEESSYKMQDYRKEVKIEAIKAAKEKAITITEIDNDYSYWSNGSIYANSMVSSNQATNENMEGIALQKLRYEVKVIFSIK